MNSPSGCSLHSLNSFLPLKPFPYPSPPFSLSTPVGMPPTA